MVVAVATGAVVRHGLRLYGYALLCVVVFFIFFNPAALVVVIVIVIVIVTFRGSIIDAQVDHALPTLSFFLHAEATLLFPSSSATIAAVDQQFLVGLLFQLSRQLRDGDCLFFHEGFPLRPALGRRPRAASAARRPGGARAIQQVLDSFNHHQV